ncbi:hypothetical protein HDV00_009680 [Rhizophlyctis rosea]|nr:hypothetical protein HDV00_009680 [Rhizophlyctis rosea]
MSEKRSNSDSDNLRKVQTWKLDWFGNSNALAYVLANMEPGTDAACGVAGSPVRRLTFPVVSYTKTHGWIWTSVTKDDLVRLIQKNHGIYEVIPESFKRKVYFDVDKTETSLEEIKKIILDRFPNARLQISGRPDSYHIILSNYYADNLEKMIPIKKFAMEHVEHGFDKSVYTRNRNMKCINQSKPQQPIQEYIEGSKTLTKHLILHDFDDDAVNIDTIDFGYEEEEIVIKGKNGKPVITTLDILSIPQHELPVPTGFDALDCTPLELLVILPNPPRCSKDAHDHNISWQVMRWCKTVGISFPDCWAWLRRKDATPERYKRYMQTWEGKHNPISPKAIWVMLERYYPDIQVSPSTLRFKEQFEMDNVRYVDGIDGKYLQGDHISPPIAPRPKPGIEPLDNMFMPLPKGETGVKHTVLLDPMGHNKTGAVIEFLKKYWRKGERVLWNTPRITLSNNTLYRLARVGIDKVVNYKDLTKEEKITGVMEDAEFVICSIQSLHYLTKHFDHVIIDEPETMFNSFKGNCDMHHGNLVTNWELLILFVENARKVVYMDAFTTKMTLNFVQGVIRKTDPHLKRNYEMVRTKSEPTRREFIELEEFDDWMTHICDCLQKGEKLYIFTPYKAGTHKNNQGVQWITEKITSYFGWEENKQVLAYYAEKEREKAKLCDVEKV